MQGKVPVGVTSVAGYTVTLAAVVGAVLAFVKGDRSDQTLGVLAAGGMAVLAFLSTQLGRYAQARAAAQAPTVREITKGEWTNHLSGELGGRVGLGFTTSSGTGYSDLKITNVTQWDMSGKGDSAPPEASLYPLTDPSTIPPDVGDGEAEGSV